MKSNKEDFLQHLKEFVSIPSFENDPKPNMPFGENIDKALSYITDLGEKFGFHTRKLDGKVGLIEFGNGKESIGILVHCDVVPAGSGWDYEPFDITILEGKAIGRGAIDDKGPALASLYAMKRLKDRGYEPKRKIQMIIGTDEETLWRDMKRFTEEEPLPVASFTPDGNFPLIHAEKGIYDFDICTYLDGKSEFKNKNIELIDIIGGSSRNSVADYVKLTFKCNTIGKKELMSTLENYTSQNHLKYKIEFEDDFLVFQLFGKGCHAMTPEKGINAINHGIYCVDPLLNEESKLRYFNQLIALDYYGIGLGCNYEDELSGKLTLNVGQVKLKEDHMVLSIDVRYPVKTDPYELDSKIQNAFHKTSFEFTLIDHLTPLYVSEDSQLVKTLLEVYQSHTNDHDTAPLVIGGGTYARVLPNTVAFGPVFPWQEETAHEPNEFIEISHLEKLIDIYEDALKKLSELEF